jgi:hypothetical protein
MKNFTHTMLLLSLFAVSIPEVSANPPPAYEEEGCTFPTASYVMEPMARVMVPSLK